MAESGKTRDDIKSLRDIILHIRTERRKLKTKKADDGDKNPIVDVHKIQPNKEDRVCESETNETLKQITVTTFDTRKMKNTEEIDSHAENVVYQEPRQSHVMTHIDGQDDGCELSDTGKDVTNKKSKRKQKKKRKEGDNHPGVVEYPEPRESHEITHRGEKDDRCESSDTGKDLTNKKSKTKQKKIRKEGDNYPENVDYQEPRESHEITHREEKDDRCESSDTGKDVINKKSKTKQKKIRKEGDNHPENVDYQGPRGIHEITDREEKDDKYESSDSGKEVKNTKSKTKQKKKRKEGDNHQGVVEYPEPRESHEITHREEKDTGKEVTNKKSKTKQKKNRKEGDNHPGNVDYPEPRESHAITHREEKDNGCELRDTGKEVTIKRSKTKQKKNRKEGDNHPGNVDDPEPRESHEITHTEEKDDRCESSDTGKDVTNKKSKTKQKKIRKEGDIHLKNVEYQEPSENQEITQIDEKDDRCELSDTGKEFRTKKLKTKQKKKRKEGDTQPESVDDPEPKKSHEMPQRGQYDDSEASETVKGVDSLYDAYF